VQCFRTANSTPALIRQLDRPGILTLRDSKDRPVYALLIGLTDDAATLRFGTATRTVSLMSLATLWRGEFATFWRAPPDYAGAITDSRSGPAAQWVAQQLATALGDRRQGYFLCRHNFDPDLMFSSKPACDTLGPDGIPKPGNTCNRRERNRPIFPYADHCRRRC
jgi:general secretion pathway protein A